MAEVLIRCFDNPDEKRGPLQFRAGDVITVQEDGWPWSQTELTHPLWRIIKLPGVAAQTLLDLLEARRDQDGLLLCKRNKMIDVVNLPAAIRTRLQNNQVITLNASERTALLARKIDRVLS